ncbi:MAG: transcriptional regulator [Candidatus Bathyarchaeota archaeon B63]|nr:MAG: transcriptional regulator [Candidatus Bathyarchaeota archaeon B63]
MIARELMAKHKLKQLDVANLMGVSQSAVSLYSRKIRGRAIDLEAEEDIVNLISDTAASLANGEMLYKDFIMRLCEICRLVRSKGLMCKLHKIFDPSVNIEECELCSVTMLRCL